MTLKRKIPSLYTQVKVKPTKIGNLNKAHNLPETKNQGRLNVNEFQTDYKQYNEYVADNIYLKNYPPDQYCATNDQNVNRPSLCAKFLKRLNAKLKRAKKNGGFFGPVITINRNYDGNDCDSVSK